ncbi:MAG: LamG domain-containing protein [Woeseiaceae bacterium]
MHLPLDGNLNDSSGNGNNGVFQGGSTNPGFATAIYNQGLNFDGNNDYITVPSFDPGSIFSASLWVNHDNIGTLNTFIEHANNGNNRNDFYIGYDNSNNQLTVELEDNNNFEGGACGDPKFCTGIPLNSNRWYHIVVTVTPTTLKVYVDATLGYSVTHSTTVNFGTGSWLLGGDTDNTPVTTANNDYLDGRLDDVRIYNTELTQTEISNLYGLVGEWNFDNCNVTNANDITDSSGNNLHASPINGVTTSSTGKICTALTLDGTNDYAEVADNNLLDITQSLTVMTWIRPNSIPSSGLMSILSKDENYEFHIDSSGRIFWWWNNSSGATRSFTSSAAISANVWTHVAIVYEAGSQRIVINGVESGTRNYNETLLTNTDPLQFGGDQGFAGREFDGLIDEIKIYSRALTTEEINGYYTNPDPLSRTCATCTSSQTIILSTNNTETLGGLSFTDGSLAEYSPSANSSTLYFNENLFSGNEDINAVHILANGIIILSTDNNATLGGLSFRDDDLVAYDPSNDTATLYFDGGNLFSNGGEDIDAVYIRDNGNIILSTVGDATLGGISFTDGDLIEYNPSTDSASLFFDESNFNGGADIDGVHILANGNILLSTTNNETLGGLSFNDGSIAEYNPGTDAATLYFDENLFSGGADINALTLPSNAPPLHHIQITHDGTALTCEPETITVTACANAACTTPNYASDVSVTLTPTGWEGSGGDTKTITGGSSTFQLRNSTAGTVTLSASASSPATSITPSPAVSCINSAASSNSCDITFYDSGFIYTIPTQTSCTTSNSITIQAVRLDTISQACVPAFQNIDRNLKVWANYSSPTAGAITGTPTVTLVNGNGSYALPSTEPASTNTVMSFTNSADETFTVTYPDAGQLVLNTKYEGSTANSDTGLTMLGNSTFVVKPAKLYVYSDDANASCATNDGTCSAFKPAGSAADSQFNLKVRAACADNTVTPNFVLNNIAITHTNTAPAIAQGSIGVSIFNMASADSGEHTISSQTYTEVGVTTFTATSPTYLGVTSPFGTSTYIGRFYPHHFDTTVAASCNTFSYSGQPFSVTATARNNAATPATTVNYNGGFAFDTTISNAGNTSNFNATNTIPLASFNNGIANKLDVAYTFSAKETAPETITLRANDTNTSGASGVTEGTMLIRSGRTYLENSFGSELVDMKVPAQVQYYTANGFVINTDDTCSAVTASLTDVGTDTVTLGDGSTVGQTCVWDSDGESGTFNCAATGLASLQFEEPPISGSFNLYLKAPGANFTGDIGITLGSPTWLKYDWDGDGNHDNDPSSVASFGLYRGDDRIIYWREVF